MKVGEPRVWDRSGLEALFVALRENGYRVVGPTLRDGAIVYDDIGSVSDLPEGWTDEQEAGRYRVVPSGDHAFFGFAAGPHSWKKFLHPPQLVLWRARRSNGGFELMPAEDQPPPLALVGVRACDLAAIHVQDRVLREGAYIDPHYRARRQGLFVVALNCSRPGGTCFCASMGTGPRVTAGFDLVLTELSSEGTELLVEAGSERGAAVAAQLPHRDARPEDVARGREVTARTEAAMGRTLDTAGLKEALSQSYEHPRWEQVGARCLSCANCTMVCPTCFCATVEDASDLAGGEARRERRWDSCFGIEFSYIHGGSVRTSAGARYRQWLLHKLATWHDQFGSSGCVGCGRCITWCPVGIDITEEASAVRASASAEPRAAGSSLPGGSDGP